MYILYKIFNHDISVEDESSFLDCFINNRRGRNGELMPRTILTINN